MMNKTRILIASGVSTLALVAGVVSPARAQDQGGVTTTVSALQSIEVTRNPSLTAGNSDTRTLATTDLAYVLNSKTRGSELEISVGGQLRYTLDDKSGTNDGVTFGGEALGLTYSTKAPRATIDASVRYTRNNLDFINASDLINADDGTVSTDFTNVTGTGTRENLTYNFNFQYDQNGPFGWGAEVSGSRLNYSNTSSTDLVDNTTLNTSLNAQFKISPTLTISAQAGYLQRDTALSSRTTTRSFELGATAMRSDNFEVRGNLSFANPDTGNTRTTVSAGFTTRPSETTMLSFDLGATFADDFGTQVTGRMNYNVRPTTTSRFNVQLNTNVTDSINNDVVLNTVASLGAEFELTSLTSLSINASYAKETELASGLEQFEASRSVQLNRQLTKDWRLSVGGSQITRKETGLDRASTESIFLNIGREWTARR